MKLLDAIAALRHDTSAPGPSADITTTLVAPSPSTEDRAERRQVTVMFSDLVGSMALSARMDAISFLPPLRTPPGRQRLAKGAMKRFQQRRIPRTDLQVSVLGLGGAPLGDLYERIPRERALATLETAYRRGIRLFDTAPLYGHGLSEHRLGHVLRDKPRSEFVISTKVGRWLRPERSEQVDRGQFVGGLNFQTVYDYSYDGTMRALEQSYQRLGMDRIDIALIHDVDIWTHGSAEAYERRFRQAMDGAYRALEELRRLGVVRAIGVGINDARALRSLRQRSRVRLLPTRRPIHAA